MIYILLFDDVGHGWIRRNGFNRGLRTIFAFPATRIGKRQNPDLLIRQPWIQGWRKSQNILRFKIKTTLLNPDSSPPRHVFAMTELPEWPMDRDRKSLQVLTKQFVDILKSSESGCLNLRDVRSHAGMLFTCPGPC